ncbi:Lipid IVA 3-deoxy-D-manno-octulosonic acid transferase [often with also] [Halomonas citrativorans]|uniref:3-deoxy-D-manno-octulosonic acid transferase n=1 Tax=Halomonas citrativorans TaxID=2742612 RepID=A0A1R4HUN6_9GAMM|nr:lipid IV(A) 3-deoxy-D-manno-octulosonic acid transferase [Halomonas citrativorans]SJN11255.1 Lipid IVA 3-deoxy-D-manno-octulosonic acid transferase [often with also] [Halomonas citrativorans]
MGRINWPCLGYSAALYALSPLIGWRIWREQVPTYSRWQRLGRRLGKLPTPPRIWLHCASVGEVRAARPLIEGLLTRYPRHNLLLTTMTATGARQAQALIEQQLDHHSRLAHCFLPLDFPGAAKRFVRRVAPELAIMFETELWPNLLHACQKHGTPVAVVNGRLSPKAFKRYQKIAPLMARTLANVDWLAAKSADDAKRFEALGAVPGKTAVVGSLKFEVSLPSGGSIESERLLLEWGERPVWVAGSTRDGEEALLLEAHRQLLHQFPDALLVLVPRHPQRFDEVAALCKAKKWETSRRSQGEPVTPATQVYLGDTLGELGVLYGAGLVAFVGGSLVPLGGHNVLEPAALGKPVLSGPFVENFADVVEPLEAAGALTLVADVDALVDALQCRFADSKRCLQEGLAGQSAIKAQQGALARTLEGLEALSSAER